MNVGIIGSGKVGSALGELWAAGHQVMFSFSRSLQNVYRLYSNWYERDRWNTAEAANFADVVLFAPTFWLVQEAIAQAGSRRQDCNRPRILPLG